MSEFEYAVRVVKDGEEHILLLDAGSEEQDRTLAESFLGGNQGKYQSEEFDHYEVVYRPRIPWETYKLGD